MSSGITSMAEEIERLRALIADIAEVLKAADNSLDEDEWPLTKLMIRGAIARASTSTNSDKNK